MSRKIPTGVLPGGCQASISMNLDSNLQKNSRYREGRVLLSLLFIYFIINVIRIKLMIFK